MMKSAVGLVLVTLAAVSAQAAGVGTLGAAYRDAGRGVIRASELKQAEETIKVPEEAWNKLVAKIAERGTFNDGGGVIPSYFGLERIVDPSGKPLTSEAARGNDRDADYASAFGGVDQDQVFHPMFVDMVSESWRKNAEGKLVIDQWLFRISMDGQVRMKAHYVMVQTVDGSVLAHDAQEQKPGEAKAKIDALTALWQGY